MPAEPPPTSWTFPTPERFDPNSDLVGMGADLEPGTILAAYRRGLFPMPTGHRRDPMGWWSPLRRGVLPVRGLRVSRSLRRAARDFEIRVDTAFEEVVAACAEPGREGGWINRDIAAAYLRLHELGWVHSVEAWRGDRLAGGLYGVAIGGLFAGESMFHRESNASKVALMGLVGLLEDEHGDSRLVDTQWLTPHLAGLGVVGIPRSEYLARLAAALLLPVPVALDQTKRG